MVVSARFLDHPVKPQYFVEGMEPQTGVAELADYPPMLLLDHPVKPQYFVEAMGPFGTRAAELADYVPMLLRP